MTGPRLSYEDFVREQSGGTGKSSDLSFDAFSKSQKQPSAPPVVSPAKEPAKKRSDVLGALSTTLGPWLRTIAKGAAVAGSPGQVTYEMRAGKPLRAEEKAQEAKQAIMEAEQQFREKYPKSALALGIGGTVGRFVATPFKKTLGAVEAAVSEPEESVAGLAAQLAQRFGFEDVSKGARLISENPLGRAAADIAFGELVDIGTKAYGAARKARAGAKGVDATTGQAPKADVDVGSILDRAKQIEFERSQAAGTAATEEDIATYISRRDRGPRARLQRTLLRQPSRQLPAGQYELPAKSLSTQKDVAESWRQVGENIAESAQETRAANEEMRHVFSGPNVPTGGPLKFYDVGGALGEALTNPAYRPLVARTGTLAVGGTLSQSEDERLAASGRALIGLTLGSMAYPYAKTLARTGTESLRDAVASTPQGQTVLNVLSRDILTDPLVKSAVNTYEREFARFKATGKELSAQARALGPTANRTLSDVIEGEVAEKALLSPEDASMVFSLAERIRKAINPMERAMESLDIYSGETLAKRSGKYLRRMYATPEAERAVEGATEFGGGKIRAPKTGIRKEWPIEERIAAGEIREADQRVMDTFNINGRLVATTRLFKTLAEMPGVVEQSFKDAFDATVNAKTALKAAQEAGDTAAEQAAKKAFAESKLAMREIGDQFTKKGGEFVRLPDTANLGALRGAVVRRDVADYLNNVDDFVTAGSFGKIWNEALHYAKKAATVYNPATHVNNFMSNVVQAHLAGIPIWKIPSAIKDARADLRKYGPATRFLSEAGVVERGLPTYGDLPARGLAKNKEALRVLARTTRPETKEALAASGITPMSNVELAARKMDAKVSALYGNSDTIFRVALLQQYLKEGISQEDALKKMLEVLPTYETRSPALKVIKNTVSPFIMYPVKYIPSTLNLIVQHPERWATLAAMWGALDYASRKKYGNVEEKDLPKQQRPSRLGYLMPGRVQADIAFRPLLEQAGAEGGDNKYTVDISRYTPLAGISGSGARGSAAGALVEGMPPLLYPSGPLPTLAARMANVDPFTGQQWITPADEPADKARKILGAIAQVATPSAVSFHIPRVIEDIKNRDKAAALLDALGLVGARPQVVRPGAEQSRAQRAYEEALNTVRYELRRDLQKAKSEARQNQLIQKAEAKILRLSEKYQKELQ